MKYRLLPFLFSFLLVTFSITAQAAAETYKLDPSHSYVLWHISHLDFSHYSGKWPANGSLVLDEVHPENSKITVLIRIANLITGDAELNKHLLGDSFFDVKKFPTASFVSNKVTVTGKNTATVDGTLTLHGVAKPISLAVTLNKLAANPFTDKKTAGFTASTTLKRSDFGISNLLPQLGDEVKIDIDAEAAKAS